MEMMSLKSIDLRTGLPFSSTDFEPWRGVRLIRFTGELSPVVCGPCLVGDPNLTWSLVLLSSSSSPSELTYEEIDFVTPLAFFGERGFGASFAAGLRPRPVVAAGFRAGLAPRPVWRLAAGVALLLPAGGAGAGSSSSSEPDMS